LPSFEWDSRKAESNFRKHGVRFEEACLIFADLLSLTVPDPDYTDENRFITIGKSGLGRLLVVVHTEREETIRLIGARMATRHERVAYEEGI
jgi:uncharacterized DUF497 family protein